MRAAYSIVDLDLLHTVARASLRIGSTFASIHVLDRQRDADCFAVGVQFNAKDPEQT